MNNFLCILGGHSWGAVQDNRQTCQYCCKVRTIECSHKWGEMKDLSQKCEKCGIVEQMTCKQHIWRKEGVLEGHYIRGGGSSVTHLYRCSKCGEIKKEKLC